MPDTDLGYRKMKKNIIASVALFIMVVSAKAQFPMFGMGLGWGTEAGSPAWCWQQQQINNAIDNQIMMMRMQQLNYYRQQTQDIENWIRTNPTVPYPGSIVTQDGTILNNENINDYERVQVNCEHCDGGFNYKKIYIGNGQTITRKSRCTYCHGTGTVSRHVER